jgi:hypothetical protein
VTCATYSINWPIFITELKSVYSAVRTGPLNKAFCASSWNYGLRWITHKTAYEIESLNILAYYAVLICTDTDMNCYSLKMETSGCPRRVCQFSKRQDITGNVNPPEHRCENCKAWQIIFCFWICKTCMQIKIYSQLGIAFGRSLLEVFRGAKIL